MNSNSLIDYLLLRRLSCFLRCDHSLLFIDECFIRLQQLTHRFGRLVARKIRIVPLIRAWLRSILWTSGQTATIGSLSRLRPIWGRPCPDFISYLNHLLSSLNICLLKYILHLSLPHHLLLLTLHRQLWYNRRLILFDLHPPPRVLTLLDKPDSLHSLLSLSRYRHWLLLLTAGPFHDNGGLLLGLRCGLVWCLLLRSFRDFWHLRPLRLSVVGLLEQAVVLKVVIRSLVYGGLFRDHLRSRV